MGGHILGAAVGALVVWRVGVAAGIERLGHITLAGGVGLAVVWAVVWWLVRAWVASSAARTAERRYVQRQMRAADGKKINRKNLD